MANNTQCNAGPGSTLVPGTTDTRVCGLQRASNASILETCCYSSPVREYGCTQFCNSNTPMNQFARCIADEAGDDSILGFVLFCQDGVVANTTQSLSQTSGGTRSLGNPFGLRALCCSLILSFILSVQASDLPVRKSHLMARQESSTSSCSAEILMNYTSTRNSIRVSGRFACGESFCPFSVPVDIDPFSNNRTINGTSAAESRYDPFFNELETIAKRKFPAASGVNFNHDFLASPGNFYMAFTPFAWCASAVTNCSEIVGDPGVSQTVEACGPLFVSDAGNEGDVSPEKDIIQGSVSQVTTD